MQELKPSWFARATIALVLATSSSAHEVDTAKEIERYRQMLADGNPAELVEAKGEDLWKQKRGPKNVSLEACDLGLGPGKLEGAYAQLPRYFKDVDAVMDFESRLVHCMVTLQGFKFEDVTRKPFSGTNEPATDLEMFSAYVSGLSRGAKIALPQAHAKEREAYARGEKIFYYRGGPYDFSCASCHGIEGQRIRLQDLPNFLKPEAAQNAFATWPGYRVSQGAVRSMQWRIYDCFRQQRFPELKYASQVSVDLITYLGVKASGGSMDAPALKR